MDGKTCLQKLKLVGVLNVATVDEKGNPQVRNISAVHYEEDFFFFFTARGKNFAKELDQDGRCQILVHTRFNEMIRVSGVAKKSDASLQEERINLIFSEQPYLSNVYPGDTRKIGVIYEIRDMQIEYFNLGTYPIFRETYTIGNYLAEEKGYEISHSCISCGKCQTRCPQKAIEKGKTYVINKSHCLHCGACYEICPVKAIKRL
ncbi:MAG: 4Fe-4S binding protein [Bacilli bacterium]